MTSPSEPTKQQLSWAREYDAYDRLAGTPEKLQRLLRSARNSFQTRGKVPDWCGTELLRGWAFLLADEIVSEPSDELSKEWGGVVGRLPDYPGAPHDRDYEPPFPTEFSQRPKMHREADFLLAKQRRLWEPHVSPINRFVDEIRSEIESDLSPTNGLGPEVYVPYVDPDSGGAGARVLFVLESPARKAALGGGQGSGMLSADNNDETAKNMWEAYRTTGMPRSYGLHWNAVPWFVGSTSKNAGVTPAQIERGRRYLLRLLDLAPNVRVLVAFGKPAQASVQGLRQELAARGIEVVESIHPGPQNYASPTRDARSRVHQAFESALALVEG